MSYKSIDGFLDNAEIKVTLPAIGDVSKMVMINYGRSCPKTDYANILGCDGYYWDKKGTWITMSPHDRIPYYNDEYLGINPFGDVKSYNMSSTDVGIRPVIRFKDVINMPRIITSLYKKVEEIELGEYPQTEADVETTNELKEMDENASLNTTGKEYTMIYKVNGKDVVTKLPEYEYKGKKYVKIPSVDKDDYLDPTSERRQIPVWIEVEPITWLIDKEEGTLISKKILASGINLNRKIGTGANNNRINFDNTEMGVFLNDIFLNDILPSTIKEKTKEEIEREEKKKNPYHFEMQEVGEEEILKGAIESGVPVFIHGKSGDGKSARVREIDPDCTIIYLLSEGEEKINGIDAYSGEDGMISEKPVWLKKLEEKCEKEPDKTHILFFDELTNAHKTVQAAVFNIILNKEVKGLWKLPDNVRIVAAGNETEESIAANELAEPLFNRFAHVYIETTPENWLEWASKHGIHPAIYTFIGARGEKSLRTEYTGEEPNADPRKWEMASKMLYATNNPKMLRGLLGEHVTNEFVEFCNQPVITVQDVLDENYTEEEIESLNISQQHAAALSLSSVDEENVEQIRNFTKKIGPEFVKIFDALWARSDEKRLERIEELRIKDKEAKEAKKK